MREIEEVLAAAGGHQMGQMGMFNATQMNGLNSALNTTLGIFKVREVQGLRVVPGEGAAPARFEYRNRVYTTARPSVLSIDSSVVVANGATSAILELESDSPFILADMYVSSFTVDGWYLSYLKLGPDFIIDDGMLYPCSLVSEARQKPSIFAEKSYGLEVPDKFRAKFTNRTGAAGAPPLLVFEGKKLFGEG